MAADKFSSERFAPVPSVTNFERHVDTIRKEDGITVTHTDEDDKLIALVVDPGDEEAQQRAERLAKDRFYDVTSGYREDVDKFAVVLEGQ